MQIVYKQFKFKKNVHMVPRVNCGGRAGNEDWQGEDGSGHDRRDGQGDNKDGLLCSHLCSGDPCGVLAFPHVSLLETVTQCGFLLGLCLGILALLR